MVKARAPFNVRSGSASPSSRGLGHRPFTAVTRVRIPLGTPFKSIGYAVPVTAKPSPYPKHSKGGGRVCDTARGDLPLRSRYRSTGAALADAPGSINCSSSPPLAP